MTTCKIDGCANDAPARGRYARLCIAHRQTGLTGSTSAAPPVPQLPEPEEASVAERSLVDLATELEHAGADLEAAQERYDIARAALADHPTIARLQDAA